MELHGTGNSRQSGVTALELLITLSISGLLLVTGAPALQQFSRLQEIKAATTALQQDLLAARGDAVLNGRVVIACPGAPESGCASGPDWSGGWIVFEDSDGDRALSVGEAVIRQGQLMQEVTVLTTSGRGPLRFFPDGSAPGTNMSISLCGLSGPADARKLVVSNIGRIRRDTWPDLDTNRCPV